MADPLLVTLVTGAVGTVFGLLVRDRIKGLEADRDAWKAAWKELADRDLKRRHANGESGPPPEDTRNIRLMVEQGSRQDYEDGRQARMLRERAQGAEPSSPLEAFGPRIHPQSVADLHRYTGRAEPSTPPDPDPIIPEHRQGQRTRGR